MRILITNDDGIHAEGLDVCAEIGRALSEDVWVIAPEFDQSGVSHSLSLNDPLRLREVGERRFAVKGTPTDCVIMGARHVIKDRPPDLVLAGVNRGRNAGEDVIYSGTVAGAVEGTILGIPSVALSQAYKSRSGEPPGPPSTLSSRRDGAGGGAGCAAASAATGAPPLSLAAAPGISGRGCAASGASSSAAGGYRYGLIPAHCTRPSQR